MTAFGLVRYANPFQGSESHIGFSQGSTYPAIACPFGMNFWSPQSSDSRWFYRRSDRLFQGIRCTHQPSPWMGDYGHFVLMPFTGDLCLGAQARASSVRPQDEEAFPHYYATFLRRYQTLCELSPTVRGAILRLTFPSQARAGFQIALFEDAGEVRIDPQARRIEGWTHANSGGVPDNFACYFALQWDANCQEWGVFEAESAFDAQTQRSGSACGAYVYFESASVVTVRIATSFISQAQARHNLP